MHAQKSIFIFCCLVATLPSLACQMGNKTYGHYQRKQSKQDVYVGPDRASRQKQTLWELAKTKRAMSRQGHFHSSTSCLANPYQTAGLPTVAVPYVPGHQEASNRPLFASRSAIGAMPVAVCTMLLLANVAQAALPTQPESQVATGNRTALDGALQQFAAMADAYHNFEQENPYRTSLIGASDPIKAEAHGVAQAKMLGAVKGEAQAFAHELESAEAMAAKPGSSARTVNEMNDDLWDALITLDSSDLEKRAQAANKALEIIPHYHQVNPEEALNFLTQFIEKYHGRLWQIPFSATAPDDDMLLRFLHCAQQFNPGLFEEYSKKMLEQDLQATMLVALTHPDAMRNFEGSTLSLDKIIEKAFEQALMKDGEIESFKQFLQAGESLHAKYQDRIAAMLLPFLKIHPENADEIVDLIKSPIVRTAAFQAITKYSSASTIESLPNSRFKEFAKAVCALLRPTQTYPEYICNREKLQRLLSDNEDFAIQLDSIRSSSPDYYFNALWSKTGATDDASKIHLSVEQKLNRAELRGDMMFGYVKSYSDGNYYRFYACASDDVGHTVWASPFNLKERTPFVVHEDVVYWVSNTNEIVLFNKFNGSIIKTIKLPVQDKIKDIHIADKTLFALYEDHLCIANLETKSHITPQLPPSINTNKYHFIGDKIIFVTHNEERTRTNIRIFDKKGSEQIFDIDSFDTFLSLDRIVQGNQDMLWYADNNRKKVIFLDFATGKKLWEYQLADRLKEAQLSKKGDKLFLLTAGQLIALDMRSTPATQPILLWQTSIEKGEAWHRKEITNIVVSDDGSVVYGIHDDFGGALFQFDSQTGAKRYLYDVNEARTHRLLGTYDGKLYIQPIFF